MKRRHVIAGLGSMATGSSLVIGSGAFGSIEADRDVSVNVVNDRDAYLALTPTASDFSKTTANSNLKFVFDGNVSPPGGTNEDTGDGVSPNAIYEFPDLFKAENQGPDDIVVFGQGSTEEGIETNIITSGKTNPVTPENPSETILTPGGDQTFGLRLDIGDVSPPVTIGTSVMITAATADSERFPGVLSD